MRRYGDPIIQGQRYTLRPGAYALLVRDGDVLLTVQTTTKQEIQLPGGGIDPGESSVQALHREVMEETGWKIRLAKKIGVYQRYVFMPEYELWAHKICHIFLARPTRKISEPTEPDHSVLWTNWRDAAAVLDNDGDAEIVSAFLKTH